MEKLPKEAFQNGLQDLSVFFKNILRERKAAKNAFITYAVVKWTSLLIYISYQNSLDHFSADRISYLQLCFEDSGWVSW